MAEVEESASTETELFYIEAADVDHGDTLIISLVTSDPEGAPFAVADTGR